MTERRSTNIIRSVCEVESGELESPHRLILVAASVAERVGAVDQSGRVADDEGERRDEYLVVRDRK